MLPETFTANALLFKKTSSDGQSGTVYKHTPTGQPAIILTIKQTSPSVGKTGPVRTLFNLSLPTVDPITTVKSNSRRVTANFTVTHSVDIAVSDVLTEVKTAIGVVAGTATAVTVPTLVSDAVDGMQ